MRVLDGVNTRSLASSRCESFPGVRCTGFTDGDCLWDLSLGRRTGDGKFDGESFWVGCGWFWGGGVRIVPIYILSLTLGSGLKRFCQFRT
jgi:hypothetical protein